MFTCILIGLGTIVASAAVAVATHDGKDHTSEMDKFESEHPYTSAAMNAPYDSM